MIESGVPVLALDADGISGGLAIRPTVTGEALEGRPGELPPGTPVASGAAFGWSWLADLLEDYGFEARRNLKTYAAHQPLAFAGMEAGFRERAEAVTALLHHDANLGLSLLHAGLPPQWSLQMAQACAIEVQRKLLGEEAGQLYDRMYGNEPDTWRDDLDGWDRITRLAATLRPEELLELARLDKGSALAVERVDLAAFLDRLDQAHVVTLMPSPAGRT